MHITHAHAHACTHAHTRTHAHTNTREHTLMHIHAETYTQTQTHWYIRTRANTNPISSPLFSPNLPPAPPFSSRVLSTAYFHSATHCNTLQHTATKYNNACVLSTACGCSFAPFPSRRHVMHCVAVRCSALQCVAVRCSALQCVAVRCVYIWCILFLLPSIHHRVVATCHWNSLKPTATQCNLLQPTATQVLAHCIVFFSPSIRHSVTRCKHSVTHCNPLQSTATHCNPLQLQQCRRSLQSIVFFSASFRYNVVTRRPSKAGPSTAPPSRPWERERTWDRQTENERERNCSVLQNVAVCCSVLQCVAVCCSKLILMCARRVNMYGVVTISRLLQIISLFWII